MGIISINIHFDCIIFTIMNNLLLNSIEECTYSIMVIVERMDQSSNLDEGVFISHSVNNALWKGMTPTILPHHF